MKVVRKEGEGSKRLALLLKGLQTTKVAKVGWFKNNKYPIPVLKTDKAKKAEEDNKIDGVVRQAVPVAYVATIQEYGYPEGGIPARPFMRPAIIKNIIRWQTIAKMGAKKMLEGELDAEQVLDQIGSASSGDIRKEITELESPALAEETVRARTRKYANTKKSASDKPLVETGQLLDTLTYAVTGRKK